MGPMNLANRAWPNINNLHHWLTYRPQSDRTKSMNKTKTQHLRCYSHRHTCCTIHWSVISWNAGCQSVQRVFCMSLLLLLMYFYVTTPSKVRGFLSHTLFISNVEFDATLTRVGAKSWIPPLGFTTHQLIVYHFRTVWYRMSWKPWKAFCKNSLILHSP